MEYGSNVLIGGTATASSIFGAGYEADKAVDGNIATFWNSSEGLPNWWKYDFGSETKRKIRKLRIYSYYDGSGSYTKDFVLAGSNDDLAWSAVYSGQQPNADGYQDHTFSNSISYRYYRITVSTMWRGDAPFAVIKELQMMENAAVPVNYLHSRRDRMNMRPVSTQNNLA